jgi:uncharacterized protein YndB with AHSA1/START domain
MVKEKNRSNHIQLTRVYDAPLSMVWDAWTVPEQVQAWWGPRGFTLTTHSKDLRPGGTWRYTMHGPDGVDYPNVATYHVVERHQRLVYDHGATDASPPRFQVMATFSESDGKTTLSLTFTLPSVEAATQTALHIKAAGGNATWDRLAEFVEERCTGKQLFVINRTLDAPIARVFEAWAQPNQLAQWLPPAGMQMRFLRARIAQGQSSFFVIEGEHGTMHVRTEYLALQAPQRIVYRQQFVDAHEQPAPAPGSPVWPPMLLMTVLLTEEAPDRTRVTVHCEAEGAASSAEIAALVAERSGMTRGWTGSFDALEDLLLN